MVESQSSSKHALAAGSLPLRADDFRSQSDWQPGLKSAEALSLLSVSDDDKKKFDAVKQGSYGDCYFEAPLAALAGSSGGAAAIAKMIEKNADGSYTVTFPGAKNQPIAITQDDLSGFNTINRSKEANILETAFLKFNGVSPRRNGAGSDLKLLSPQKFSSETLALLTGKPATSVQIRREGVLIPDSKEHIESDLRWAFRNHELVVAGTGDLPVSERYSGGDPVARRHVYSVVDYDEKSHSLTLRNPWGRMEGDLESAGGTKDGITSLGRGYISMSVDTFRRYFDEMIFTGESAFNRNSGYFINDITSKRFGESGKDLIRLTMDEIGSCVVGSRGDLGMAMQHPSWRSVSKVALDLGGFAGGMYLGSKLGEKMSYRLAGGLGNRLVGKIAVPSVLAGTISASGMTGLYMANKVGDL